MWIDLTVENAEAVRDFYAEVIGWKSEPVSMDDYNDYIMKADAEPIAGICHARGVNANLPPVWIPYFQVKSLENGLQSCIKGGGAVITPIKSFGEKNRYAIIQAPSGAVCGIWEEN